MYSNFTVFASCPRDSGHEDLEGLCCIPVVQCARTAKFQFAECFVSVIYPVFVAVMSTLTIYLFALYNLIYKLLTL